MNNHNRHILFICTEDWFFASHFLPLNDAALSLGRSHNTSILSSTGSMRKGLEKMGLQVIPVDFARRSMSPLSTVRLFYQLAASIGKAQPSLIHFIALKPILVGGLIALFFPKTAKVYHVTGLGTIAEGISRRARLFRAISFRLVTFYLRRKNSWLIVENPDDLRYLKNYGHIPADRVSLFGGAGINPEAWSQMPPPENKVPRIAFVGRMIMTKGVDVLVEAMKILFERGVRLELDLYGEPDRGNPRDISFETLEEWNELPGITWHGITNDVHLVWWRADIGVVPTRTREGMPRAMLEAAACGRPQIVTDIPGCRHFIRDGGEGLVVPPEDPQALADALEKLAGDPALRQKMGEAARRRVLDGYTEEHVRDKTREIYRTLLERK